MTGETPKKLTYISVFSGIEAASVAWEPLGFEPVAFAEVDPFPSAVLKERYPHVPNLGDITKIDWSNYHGKIDIVVGGSPCQSFSVAGKREGLSGESGLMFEYIRAVREIRPKYFVWENVPGAFSSEKGEAFRQLLAEMDDLGYGMAWRVLDAQFAGVAQRRRRVFLVGCLGDPEGAAEILFEPDSLRWDHPPSREKRQELAAAAQSRAGRSYTFVDRCGNNWKNGKGGCGVLMQDEVASTIATIFPQTLLQLDSGTKEGTNITSSVLTEESQSSDCFCINRKAKDEAMQGRPYADDGSSFTLTATAPHSVAYREDCLTPWDNQSKRVFSPESCGPTLNRGAGMNTTPSVLIEDCHGFSAGQSPKAGSIGIQAEQSPTLRGAASGTNQVPTVCYSIAGNIVNRKIENGGNGLGAQEDIAYTLNTIDRHAVAFAQNTRDEVRLINGDGSIAGALSASPGMKQTSYICENALPFNTTCITSPTNGNNPQWGDPCHTLAAQDHPPTIVIDRAAFNQGQNAQYSPHIEQTDVMDALVARGPHAVMCMASGQANAEIETDMTPAQSARQSKDPQIVCTTQYGEDVAGTLMAKADSSPCHDKGANVVTNGYVVRRLTPLECERLQGFPDNWTKIPYKNKPAEDCPDTPRYKALGNSFAVPVVRWIGERLQHHATASSEKKHSGKPAQETNQHEVKGLV